MKGRCRDCELCIMCDCDDHGFCEETHELVEPDKPFELDDDHGCPTFYAKPGFDPMWWYDENLEYKIAQDMRGEF